MRTCVGIGLLLGAAGWIASVDAAPPKAPGQTTLDADKLAPGVFTGTVVSTPNTDRMMTVNVTYQKLQLKPGQNLGRTNGGLQRQYNRIIQLQNQLMRPPGRGHNPMATMQQLQIAMVQFQIQAARAEANLFQVSNATQKVDFQVEENVKIRIKNLPEQFDEKGNIKRYTSSELAALKGKDKNLPYYESAVESLTPGQVVQVTLGTHKKSRSLSSTSSSASKDKEKVKDKENAKDKDTSHEHKLQVGLIVIVKDNGSSSSSPNPAKSKNKK